MAKSSHILREHTPLAPLTTMGLGGPARYLAECLLFRRDARLLDVGGG